MIILGKADLGTLNKFSKTLEKYEKVLGQRINKEKSAIYLHKRVSQGMLVMFEVAIVILTNDFPFT